MKYLAYLLPLMFLSTVSSLISAETIRVCPDGSGDFMTIQAAINVAENGDLLELCCDDPFTGDGNRDIDYLGKAITIRSECGDPRRCIIDCGGSWIDPHRGFLFQSGESSLSTLEAVTIQNGYAAGDPPDCYGGGVYCVQASPTFTKCVFSENQAATSWLLRDEHIHVRGAGMYCAQSSATLTDCIFEENSAHMHPDGLLGKSHPVLISRGPGKESDNGERESYYYVFGGGLYARESQLTLTDCDFIGNRAIMNPGNPYGGGLCVWEGSVELLNCDFKKNKTSGGANSYSQGGGAYLYHADATLSGCRFSGNRSNYQGGGVFGGSLFTHCTFDSNRTRQGGGAFSGGDFTNCTFSGNTAWGSGSAIAFAFVELNIENSIIAFGTDGAPISCMEGGVVAAVCCDVYGNSGGDWVGCLAGQDGVNGNFSADPLFCQVSLHHRGSLHMVRSNSPCLPGNHPFGEDCGLIGAHGVGCFAISNAGTATNLEISTEPVVPTAWALQATPNPFRDVLSIRYSAGADSRRKINVFDVVGRRIRSFEPTSTSGVVVWDGMNAQGTPAVPGIYFLRLEAEGWTRTARFLRLR